MAVKITCPTCGYSTTSRTLPLAEYGQRRHSCDKQLAAAARRNQRVRKEQHRTVRDCHCKEARHQHGTYAAYTIDRCRCRPCTDARARYERQRTLERMDGKTAYVDTAPAVAHIRRLQAAGLGWKRVAHLAGITPSVVYPLLYGRPDRVEAIRRLTPLGMSDRAIAELVQCVPETVLRTRKAHDIPSQYVTGEAPAA